MIFLGLGGNLHCETFGAPRETCAVALSMMHARQIHIKRCSRWFESAPVPLSDQPWFVNAVCEVETALTPNELVDAVLGIEHELGRRRSVPNAARTIDIDVIAYADQVITPNSQSNLHLPHPRMHERAFVLLPLADLAPDWHHPESGRHITALTARLDPAQTCRSMPPGSGLFGTEWHG